MTIDQSKLDRIKASLASDAKAEGVTPGPWEVRAGSYVLDIDGPDKTLVADLYPRKLSSSLKAALLANPRGKIHGLANATFIARARTAAPAMAKMLLDEILWLEYEIIHCGYMEMREGFRNRLTSIVNGWPEETL